MTEKKSIFIVKIKRYVRENWGYPFIVAFMLLLLFAAVCSSTGLFTLANDVAVYAYSAVIIGFFLQLVCFLKDRKIINAAEAL